MQGKVPESNVFKELIHKGSLIKIITPKNIRKENCIQDGPFNLTT